MWIFAKILVLSVFNFHRLKKVFQLNTFTDKKADLNAPSDKYVATGETVNYE